jgi:ATPase subunit of ABC transporter with duplicated ATPase domains
MATYLLLEDGGKITLEDSGGFVLLEVQDAVVSTTTPESMYGGGQEDVERARSERRRRLEAKQAEAEDLKRKLVKAEQDRQRKAKAKADSKAKRAIEARIERFTRELAEAEADITLLLAALAELQVSLVDQEMIRRRKLLLIAVLN